MPPLRLTAQDREQGTFLRRHDVSIIRNRILTVYRLFYAGVTMKNLL